MTLVQPQDPKMVVRAVIERELATASTLKVTLDAMYVRQQLRRLYALDLSTAEVGSLLAQESPAYGFSVAGDDSKGNRQWAMLNPRYILCPRHRVRAVLRPYVEGGALSLRAVHCHRGKHCACRVSSIRMDYLIKALPRVEILLQDHLQRNPCMVGGLEKSGGDE